MPFLKSFIYPDLPPDLEEIFLQDDKKLVVIGIIGKSSHIHCNKMVGLEILDKYPILSDNAANCKEGRMSFHFEKNGNILYIHFETSYDVTVMEQLLDEFTKREDQFDFITFNSYIRTRFARILLFAIQVCHLIVLVETGQSFDSSYLPIFSSLKLIREKYVLKFLPKLLKNSNVGSLMGKDGRLCSPRFIFFFEKFYKEYADKPDQLQKLEFEIEDTIYKMLRTEFVITNNSSMSLFSIPRNKRFVYVNREKDIHADPFLKSFNQLHKNMERCRDDTVDELDEIRPFKGFAKPFKCYNNKTGSDDDEFFADESNDDEDEIDEGFSRSRSKPIRRTLVKLLQEHVKEAMDVGFDDSMAKFKGKSHFVIPSTKSWYDMFKLLHRIFIINPDNPDFETSDPDYKAFLENFHKLMDVDERFFAKSCEDALEVGLSTYNTMLPRHYSRADHEHRLAQAIAIYEQYSRGPKVEKFCKELTDECEAIWSGGRQQCEALSLRGNPCAQNGCESNATHNSEVMIVSACNCGRLQIRRSDPYCIKTANYDFYQSMAQTCGQCEKLQSIEFPVFQPSINDYRAAQVRENNKILEEDEDLVDTGETDIKTQEEDTMAELEQDQSLHSMQENLSLDTLPDEEEENNKKKYQTNNENEEDDDLNEIVIKVGNQKKHIANAVKRLHSTTEYLPGMVQIESPAGLLPQYPSWSLLCIGPSSIYSHNQGLTEHVQGGFLSGANFLLPWDVQVRLEHAATWQAAYERKPHHRKKSTQHQSSTRAADGQVFSLKIFVGCEYECPAGHRFIMSGPDKVQRSSALRDSGSKIVFNDMPLYFPCPCRNAKPRVAQLMRVHVITPKAPVNVILDPKVRINAKSNNYTFVTGLAEPPKLSQSAYWVLRFPFVYQGDDGAPLQPPQDISVGSSMIFGNLAAGMFGIKEMET